MHAESRLLLDLYIVSPQQMYELNVALSLTTLFGPKTALSLRAYQSNCEKGKSCYNVYCGDGIIYVSRESFLYYFTIDK